MDKMTVKVEGMSCGHCVSSVGNVLAELGLNGTVKLADHMLTFDWDGTEHTLQLLKQALQEQGYDIEV